MCVCMRQSLKNMTSWNREVQDTGEVEKDKQRREMMYI